MVSDVQIDDKEFDIPQVDTPPTLESILNEVSGASDMQPAPVQGELRWGSTYAFGSSHIVFFLGNKNV